MTPLTNGRNGATTEWLREMIDIETDPEPDMETEHDAEILATPASPQTPPSIPTPPASPPPTLDALLAPEEIGIHWGVPFLHRPERADQSPAVSLGVALMVRQAV